MVTLRRILVMVLSVIQVLGPVAHTAECLRVSLTKETYSGAPYRLRMTRMHETRGETDLLNTLLAVSTSGRLSLPVTSSSSLGGNLQVSTSPEGNLLVHVPDAQQNLRFQVTPEGTLILNGLHRSGHYTISTDRSIQIADGSSLWAHTLNLSAPDILNDGHLTVDALILQAKNKIFHTVNSILRCTHHVALRQGLWVNHGLIQGRDHLTIALEGGARFIHDTRIPDPAYEEDQLMPVQGLSAAESLIFNGDGTFVNHHRVQSPQVQVQVPTLQNAGEILADNLILRQISQIHNQAQGQIVGRQSFRVEEGGVLTNEGDLCGGIGFIYVQRFLNSGRTSAMRGVLQCTMREDYLNQGVFYGHKCLEFDFSGQALNAGAWFSGDSVRVKSRDYFQNDADVVLVKDIYFEGTGEWINNARLKGRHVHVSGFDLGLNTGHIQGRENLEIRDIGCLKNTGVMQGKGTIASSQGALYNTGDISQTRIAVQTLENSVDGRITRSPRIECETGINEGAITTTHQLHVPVVVGSLRNMGTFEVQHVSGQGLVQNHGTWTFLGTDSDPATLSIRRWVNQTSLAEAALTQGHHVVVTPETVHFDIRSGIFKVHHMHMQGGHTDTPQHQIQGVLDAQTLQLDQAILAVMGELHVAQHLDGTIPQIKNEKGLLHIRGTTDLPHTSLHNCGRSVFEKIAHVDMVNTEDSLESFQGMTVRHWDNSGTAWIHTSFSLQEGKNTHKMTLENAEIHTASPLLNLGQLDIFNSHGKSASIENHKILQFSHGSAGFQALENHADAWFNPGDYGFHSLYNHHAIHLTGNRWSLTDARTSSMIGPILQVTNLQNHHMMHAEDWLIYQHCDPIMGNYHAQTQIIYEAPERTLHPEDVIGLQAPRLTVKTHNFHVHGNTAMDYPHLALYVTQDFEMTHEFQTQNLEIQAQGNFVCGKDQNLCKLTTKGRLNVRASDVDIRYGQVFAEGGGEIIAQTQDLHVGALTTRPQSYLEHGYQQNVSNGAYIASQAPLTLQALVGNILICGSVFSDGLLTLNTMGPKSRIDNRCGLIQGQEDIHITTPFYQQERSDSLQMLISSYRDSHEVSWTYYRFVNDAEAFLSTLGNIVFQCGQVHNIANTINAGEDIFLNGRKVAGKDKEFADEFTNASIREYMHKHGDYKSKKNWKGKRKVTPFAIDTLLATLPATLIARGDVQLQAQEIHQAGIISGCHIDFKAHTFTALNAFLEEHRNP